MQFIATILALSWMRAARIVGRRNPIGWAGTGEEGVRREVGCEGVGEEERRVGRGARRKEELVEVEGRRGRVGEGGRATKKGTRNSEAGSSSSSDSSAIALFPFERTGSAEARWRSKRALQAWAVQGPEGSSTLSQAVTRGRSV